MQNYPPPPPYGGQPFQPAPQPKQNFWKRQSRAGKIGIIAACIILPLSLCICVNVVNSSGGKSPAAVITDTPAATSQQQTTPAPTEKPTAIPPTATPTPVPTWKTIQSFSGDGNQNTAIFSAPDDWKISYTCTASDGMGIGGLFYVTVYGSDNSLIDDPVSADCKDGQTTNGVSEEHQSGQVYLKIISGIPWTVQIQALQ